MKIEVKTKKKPAVPSVKTMGVKKKATASSGVAVKGKKAAIKKVGKTAAITKEGKTAAITKEGKKAAITKVGKTAAITKEGKKAVASSAKEAVAKKKTAKVTPATKKDTVVDSTEKVDVKPKKVKKGKQMEKAVVAASAVKAGPKKKQKVDDKGSKPEGKKKRMRRKSRKPKIRKTKIAEETQAKPEEEEKPESTGNQKRKIDSNDSGSPAKKQKVAKKKKPEPADKEMELTGELYKIFCKRRDNLKDRVLYAMVENFKLGYYSKPPAVFDSAQHVRICAEKGLFYLEYKTKKEAEKHKLILENNSLIKHVNSMSKKSDDRETDGILKVHPRKLFIANVPPHIKRDMLAASFPTAKHVRVLPKTRCAYLIYKTKEEAEDAFVISDNVQVKGMKLTVLYLSTRKAEELFKNVDKIKNKRKKKRTAYKKSVQARKKQLNSLESQTDSSKKNE